MPSSSQYRSDGVPGAGGAATTASALPGPPGASQALPPVIVTNLLTRPLVVWMTTALFTNPLIRVKPVEGPAGPR